MHERTPPQRERIRPSGTMAATIAAFGAIYLIWGSTYLAIAVAIESIPPFVMIGIRCSVAGLVLYFWARARGSQAPSPAQWLTTLSIGALLFVGGQGLLAWGELHVPSGVAALFVSTTPIWMMLLQGASGAGYGGLRTVVAIIVGSIGLVILIGPESALGSEPFDPLGSAVLLISAVTWALGSLFAKNLRRQSSPGLNASLYLLGGGIGNLVVGALIGEIRVFDPTSVTLESLLAVAYLAVAGSIVAFGAYHWLLQRWSLTSISTHTYVNPIVAVFLGWAFGGETIGGRVIGAMMFVIPAIVLAVGGPQSSKKIKPVKAIASTGRQPALDESI